MIQNLKRSNLLSIGLAAKGTSVICCILVSCYFLFSILTNTFMVPASNFVGNIPSVLRGEFSYIITGPLYHFEWNHLMWNLLPTVVLGPFIEWKIGSVALVIGFFTSGWIGALIFCFGFGGYIQSALGISIYICLFYGASISVYALFPMSVFAFLIKNPDFSLITKAILTVAFFTLILGILPKQNATDAQKFVQIAHLSGFLAGIICVIMIFALRNWKKVFCSFFKQID